MEKVDEAKEELDNIIEETETASGKDIDGNGDVAGEEKKEEPKEEVKEEPEFRLFD
ncbi:hypothetical protein [Lentibacillus sp. Marseille-P4043]|uniref:hypothetical protein n=1 Tax=Lentibacillus sp. Marseille-P4043 TaxID=2040293 RepID=UPI0018F89C87|nr:hypothetical protein [Lentibacillus sp. Marseille-P4043]